MKNNIFLLLVISCISLTTTAQQTSEKIDTNKYRINLPDYWEKGNKVWKVLNDRLPAICEELINKDLCGDDCNPKYSIELYITEPYIQEFRYSKVFPKPKTRTVYQSYTPFHTGTFGPGDPRANFPNFLAPAETNRTDNADNSWQFITSYSFDCYLLLVENKEKVLTRIVLVDTNEVWERFIPEDYAKTRNIKNPDTFIDEHKELLVPRLHELFAIIDKKILALN